MSEYSTTSTSADRRDADQDIDSAQTAALGDLQSAAGNSAVAGMVADLRAADSSAEVPLLSPGAPAERQADALAEKVTGTAPAGPTTGPATTVDGDVAAQLDRPGGRPLDAATASALREDLGPELNGVRVHDDATSHAATAELGARAVTQGSTIHLGAGESKSADAPSLLAHEAAHAVQQNDGAIAAKLKGTANALVAMGGDTKKRGRSEYRKIVAALQKYESLEEGAVSLQDQVGFGFSALDGMLGRELDKMQAMLEDIEKRIVKWLGSKEAGKDGKSDRAAALRLVLPRVRLEKSDIASGKFADTKGYDDTKVTASEEGEAGNVNETSKVTYGSEQTYFKEDASVDTAKAAHDETMRLEQHEHLGIAEVDPRLGSRSVAMYRLDQLLGGGLIARTEFATFGSKMGIVMEKAKGRTIADHGKDDDVAMTEGDKADGQFSLEDATLQRCLARLQVIDAIAGQLDRHAGNFFIQTDDSGNVVAVTGIDNDMAFGEAMQDIEASRDRLAMTQDNYQGMPQVLDREFADRVLDPNLPALVEEALAPLLTPAEIAATLKRLEAVADVVRRLEKEDLVVDDYGLESAKASRTDIGESGSIAGREMSKGGLAPIEDALKKSAEWADINGAMNTVEAWNAVRSVFVGGGVDSAAELLTFGLTLPDFMSKAEIATKFPKAAAVYVKAVERALEAWKRKKETEGTGGTEQTEALVSSDL